MGMQAKITILTLYKGDEHLFDLLELPAEIDKDTLVSLLVTNCAPLEILYPNPEVMKNLIGLWSIQSQYTWNKLIATMTVEYNPIDNYDRTETRTNSTSAEGSSTDGGKDTISSTDSGKDTTTSTDSGTDTLETEGNNTLKVASFNTPSGSSSLSDKEKNDSSGETSTTYGKENETETTYGKENETETTYGRTNNNTYDKTESETIRARGNIGTVTTQSMLEAERQIALFNIYDEIINDFKRRYCILVY